MSARLVEVVNDFVAASRNWVIDTGLDSTDEEVTLRTSAPTNDFCRSMRSRSDPSEPLTCRART